jgi:hypothetical protein
MLADLIKRVEEGEGADRELDRDIWCALGWTWERREWLYCPDGRRRDPTSVIDWLIYQMGLTASLDAVVALVEDKLPGTEWEARRLRLFSVGRVWDRGYHDISSVAAEASSPARALLAAALKAIEETRR